MGQQTFVSGIALGAISALAAILLKAWLDHELKENKWPGVLRIAGNIGFMLMASHAVLLAALSFYCATYDSIHGLPAYNPYWPVPRQAIWFEGFVVPGAFTATLFIFRKNVMMLIAGTLHWLWAGLLTYGTFKYSETVFQSDIFPMHAEGFVSWSMLMMAFLMLVAAAAAAISKLYGIVDDLGGQTKSGPHV